MARKTRRQKQRAAARQNVPPRAIQTRPVITERAIAPEAAPDDAIGKPATAADIDTVVADAVLDEPAAQPVAAAAPAATRATTQPARRRIERLSQAAPAPARAGRPGKAPANAAAMFQPLENEDAAIPFDRVPYVPADLRRVLVMALLMVALIIIAAVIVTHVVH
jgi:hypothetical protein